MVGDVTSPYLQYFLIGFRQFTKMTFVRSGELSPPSPPRGTAPATVYEIFTYSHAAVS